MPNYIAQYRRTRTAGDITGVVSSVPSEVLQNQVAWFDAAAITGLADGDAISTWVDSSGHDRNATQSGSNRPIYKTNILNGLPVVRFALASAQYMNIGDISAAFSSAASLFAVVYLNASSAAYNIYIGSTADNWWRYSGDGLAYMRLWRTARADAMTTAMPGLTAGWRRFYYESNAGTVQMIVDGVSLGTSAAGTFEAGNNHMIGNTTTDGTRYLNGDIAELIVYSEIKSAANMLAIDKYLFSKWGWPGRAGT